MFHCLQAKEAGEDEEMGIETATEMANLGASAARQQSDFEARANAGLTFDSVSGDNGANTINCNVMCCKVSCVLSSYRCPAR